MRVNQFVWNSGTWKTDPASASGTKPQLGFLFGKLNTADQKQVTQKIQAVFPDMLLVGCSTSGEIANHDIYDESLVLTTLEFEKTSVAHSSCSLQHFDTIFDAARHLAGELPVKDLHHAIILSEGLDVNGSDLVRGLNSVLPDNVQITGGLAGDGDRFGETFVLVGDDAERDRLVLIGLYGNDIEIGFGCYGGWDTFGPDRLITKSEGNQLFELDNKPALTLYKEYLGDYAENLPSSGLHFPLYISIDKNDEIGVVRTILGIDEETQSLTFAGDIPQGKYARLMKANSHRLVDGAHQAAVDSIGMVTNKEPDLALIFSCVGRRLVLKQRTEEELEVLSEVYGNKTTLAGFYSYGEIAPHDAMTLATLHNQTMCITTISEK